MGSDPSDIRAKSSRRMTADLAGDTAYSTLLERLRAFLEAQQEDPEETPEATLRALYLTAAGTPASARKALTTELPSLTPAGFDSLRNLVEQRCSGTPLAHLTGRQDFMGIEMLAGADALIPRRETEILGNEALRLATMIADERGSVTVVDLCTGSGNIPLALLAHEPRCRVFGSDISEGAVEFARKNARHLGLEQNVDFRCGD